MALMGMVSLESPFNMVGSDVNGEGVFDADIVCIATFADEYVGSATLFKGA